MGQDLAATRRAWHGVAELVLAGPQYRRAGTIRLRVVPGGFATVAAPDLAVIGGDLVAGGGDLVAGGGALVAGGGALVAGGGAVVAGGGRVGIDGRTSVELAGAVGVDVGAPADLYHDGSGVDPDEPLGLDPDAAAVLADALAVGDAALRALAPDLTPVLWPEHFDLGISVAEVNYGLSPGDRYLDEPYAYVGPWTRREGAFWNAPFGAARPLRDLGGVDEVVAFYAEARDLL
jgi:hypothetical protein